MHISRWTGIKGKSLWDYGELLIVPLMLAGIAIWFQISTSNSTKKSAETRATVEREIEEDRARETALQNYLNAISTLLLENDLPNAKQDDIVQRLATTRTLAVFSQLDGRRKGVVLQFIYDTGLITKDRKIIDLAGADLKDTYLTNGNLMSADLSGADLSDSKLGGANFRGANLRDSILTGAIFQENDMTGANLENASMTSEQIGKANSRSWFSIRGGVGTTTEFAGQYYAGSSDDPRNAEC